MKLKINKASDLSSISVLPPHSRRSSVGPSGSQGVQSSQLRVQSSQLRSQLSQQSFSQGPSSQHGLFSQFSQSSLDEVLTNDQTLQKNSQERENSAKKFGCLPPVNYAREESVVPMSRSSNNLMRKWNPASGPDQRCQISEELERRMGMMDTLLNRFGMILDSVQSDLMQVNRGTKELSLEMEEMRQKLVAYDSSLQLMNKGQENIKASLDGGLKSISNQLGKDIHQDKFKKIFLMFTTLPEQIEASLMKLQSELRNMFVKDMQAVTCSKKIPDHNSPVAIAKKRGRPATRQGKKQPAKSKTAVPKKSLQPIEVPTVECGGSNSAANRGCAKKPIQNKAHRQKEVLVGQGTESRFLQDPDDDINAGFSCLINEKETEEDEGIRLTQDVKVETDRILRSARRTKRKYSNPIIID